MSKPGQYNWGENERLFREGTYQEEIEEMRLFPDDVVGSTASATESTGLIQVGMVSPEIQQAYDEVYSYRLVKPVAEKKND